MDNIQKDNFNLQIRKALKEFGVRAHQLIQKRFESDTSNCKISLTLKIDSNLIENVETNIKI